MIMINPFQDNEPSLAEGVFVAPGARVIGRVAIGTDSSIFYNSVVRGDVNTITLGSRTNIQDNCTLHVTGKHPLRIGSDVVVGHNAIVHGCTVGDRVLIGMGAIVLDGAVIEPDSIVAAGSLVAPGKTFASGSMVMGSPARAVRDLSSEEIASIKRVAAKYVHTKNHYLREIGS